ncbi:hypothetical protein [Thermovenabulum sp.]|uniref:GltB/FmdC/FwdC-like GXGXG domain-containing protein n=1 Tax=Thermovenabulum sp. TaxID=3100335 RepID=UPI003C7CF332
MKIDAKGMHYRELNERIHDAVLKGIEEIDIVNVLGQRYIGTGIGQKITINIYGTPGSDLGAFMDGPRINVYGSCQDVIGNTMNDGEIVIHKDAGNVLGLSMRAGKMFIKGSVGYRTGIHMKAYKDKCPVIVIGGKAGDFLGEYMAGGRLVVLGIFGRKKDPVAGRFIATGMHGGAIYIRGDINRTHVANDVCIEEICEEDLPILRKDIEEFCKHFEIGDIDSILSGPFIKLVPKSLRPYGKMYAY